MSNIASPTLALRFPGSPNGAFSNTTASSYCSEGSADRLRGILRVDKRKVQYPNEVDSNITHETPNPTDKRVFFNVFVKVKLFQENNMSAGSFLLLLGYRMEYYYECPVKPNHSYYNGFGRDNHDKYLRALETWENALKEIKARDIKFVSREQHFAPGKFLTYTYDLIKFSRRRKLPLVSTARYLKRYYRRSESSRSNSVGKLAVEAVEYIEDSLRIFQDEEIDTCLMKQVIDYEVLSENTANFMKNMLKLFIWETRFLYIRRFKSKFFLRLLASKFCQDSIFKQRERSILCRLLRAISTVYIYTSQLILSLSNITIKEELRTKALHLFRMYSSFEDFYPEVRAFTAINFQDLSYECILLETQEMLIQNYYSFVHSILRTGLLNGRDELIKFAKYLNSHIPQPMRCYSDLPYVRKSSALWFGCKLNLFVRADLEYSCKRLSKSRGRNHYQGNFFATIIRLSNMKSIRHMLRNGFEYFYKKNISFCGVQARSIDYESSKWSYYSVHIQAIALEKVIQLHGYPIATKELERAVTCFRYLERKEFEGNKKNKILLLAERIKLFSSFFTKIAYFVNTLRRLRLELEKEVIKQQFMLKRAKKQRNNIASINQIRASKHLAETVIKNFDKSHEFLEFANTDITSSAWLREVSVKAYGLQRQEVLFLLNRYFLHFCKQVQEIFKVKNAQKFIHSVLLHEALFTDNYTLVKFFLPYLNEKRCTKLPNGALTVKEFFPKSSKALVKPVWRSLVKSLDLSRQGTNNVHSSIVFLLEYCNGNIPTSLVKTLLKKVDKNCAKLQKLQCPLYGYDKLISNPQVTQYIENKLKTLGNVATYATIFNLSKSRSFFLNKFTRNRWITPQVKVEKFKLMLNYLLKPEFFCSNSAEIIDTLSEIDQEAAKGICLKTFTSDMGSEVSAFLLKKAIVSLEDVSIATITGFVSSCLWCTKNYAPDSLLALQEIQNIEQKTEIIMFDDLLQYLFSENRNKDHDNFVLGWVLHIMKKAYIRFEKNEYVWVGGIQSLYTYYAQVFDTSLMPQYSFLAGDVPTSNKGVRQLSA